MNRIFVDSNVFLRLFTDDDLAQQDRAFRLVKAAADGELSLVTGPPVLFEVAWTLRSFYRLPRGRTIEVLRRILATRGLELADRGIVEKALALAGATGQEFADAYIAASAPALRCDAIATFNREHFEKLGAKLHKF